MIHKPPDVERNAQMRFEKNRQQWESIPHTVRKAQKIYDYWARVLGPDFNPNDPTPMKGYRYKRNYHEDMTFLLGMPGLDLSTLKRK